MFVKDENFDLVAFLFRKHLFETRNLNLKTKSTKRNLIFYNYEWKIQNADQVNKISNHFSI